MEKDLEILESILRELKYTPSYIAILLNHLVSELGKSGLDKFTPNFIYSALAFEEGRHKAKEIAEYFEDYRNKGSFKTRMQQFLDKSPWMK